MEKLFIAQGIKDNEVFAPIRASNLNDIVHHFDGYMLDEIQFAAVIKSKEDIKALMDFLRCCEPCFYRPSTTYEPPFLPAATPEIS
jgi:hypothetical protein